MRADYTKLPEIIPTPCCTYRYTHIFIKSQDVLLRTANIIKAIHGWRCRIIPEANTMSWHLYIAEDDMTEEQVADLCNFKGPYEQAMEVLRQL